MNFGFFTTTGDYPILSITFVSSRDKTIKTKTKKNQYLKLHDSIGIAK